MSTAILASVPSIASATHDRCDIALRLSADSCYERYAGVLENEAGYPAISLSEEEACFLFWLADLKTVTAAMVHRIFRNMPHAAGSVARLQRRLSSAGVDTDTVFRRDGGDYRLAVDAKRSKAGANVDPDWVKHQWIVGMFAAQAVRQAA